MTKKICMFGAALIALTTACSSDNKFEQTNNLNMIASFQSPGEDAMYSATTLSTITDAYNPDNASATFIGLVTPAGNTITPKITNMHFGASDDMDRLLITSTNATKATGFGGLMLKDFRIVVTPNNSAAKATFEDGSTLFAVSNPLTFYSNTFTRDLNNPGGEPFESNTYTKNYYQFVLNPIKKTVDMVIYGVSFTSAPTSNLNLLFEGMPYTFNSSTGIITIAPQGDVVPRKYASNMKGDPMPEYTASGFKAFVYGAYDMPSFVEFSTPTLKISSSLYEYGKLPNADAE
ncbi:MAG: hypothetical protein K2M98_08555 [Muribaculum sp.]|nr:hypothetical protein [Muribaculum sp.]